MGESSTDAAAYEEYFRNQITESALHTARQDRQHRPDRAIDLGRSRDLRAGSDGRVQRKIWSWQGTDPGNEEPPGTNWQDVGDAIAEAGAVAGRVNTLELQVNDPETGLQAIGQKTDGLFVQLNVQAAGDEDWGAGDETVSPEP